MKKILLIIIPLIFIIGFTNKAIAEKRKIGLVLSGGGAKGIAHIGVLRVLEDAGIRPDYIGGTSMGAIIGALYAMGYTVDEIEQEMLSQNWDKLLSDEIELENVDINDKRYHGRFFFTLPIEDWKVNLPSGLIGGQQLFLNFSRYAFPAHEVKDFSELPVPFFCVAADIETGEYILLEEGSLPMALRATMSIPTLVKPVELNGRLLVDGGLVNNFPVLDMREKGMDIIIGSDVQDPLLKKRELNSLIKNLYQSVKFLRMENHDKAVENCDIYIKPDVLDFAPTDFDAVRQMIYRGELAAREKFEEIIELAKENRSDPIMPMPYIGLIELHDYKITGLEMVTKEIITDAFDLNLPNLYTVNDLNESVEIAYSTGFFDLIQYDIVSSGAKRSIEIKVVEKNYDELKVGIHYDSYFKAALLFNGSFRNLVFRDTKLDVVLSVGENPLVDARYWFDLENDFSFGTQFFVNNFDVFLYDGPNRTSTFDYTSSLLGAEMQKQLGKSYGAGFGLQTEFTYFSSVLSIDDFGTYDILTANAYGYLKLDTRDEPYYPKSGAKSFLEAKYIANLGDNGIDTYNQGIITFSYQKFDKISEDMVISYGVDAAAGLDTNAPPQYLVYLGGFGDNYLFSAIPFVGLEFLNVQGLYAWSLKAELRYELFKDNYLRFHANLGNNSFNTTSVFKISDLIFGTGVTYSYDSFIGPLEITFMNSNYQEDMQIYLKFGMGLY